jgi:Tol biopolymer transport system component
MKSVRIGIMRWAALVAIALAGCSGGANATGAPSAASVVNAITGPCSKPVGYGNPVWSPDSSRIAFEGYSTQVQSGSSVHIIDLTGRNVSLLAANGRLGGWSPDGKQLVYAGSGDAGSGILMMNGDGSGQARLLYGASAYGLVWSPDGRRIAFSIAGYSQNRVYVGDANSPTILHTAADSSLDGRQVWSPDGGRIVFATRRRDDNLDIYSMDIGTGDQSRLTDDPAGDDFPAWSPDGRHIAFQSSRDGHPAIYVMDADGANQTRLMAEQGSDTAPVWSPDGKHIAFVSNRDGDQEIYVMDADGSHETRLTDSPRDDNSPTWSPDGTKIAFVSWRDNNPDIFVMNADGSGQAQLTVNPAKARCLKWPF